MPDSRVQIIRSTRLRLGEAPRSVADDKQLRIQKPLLSFGMRAGEKSAYENFTALLERGRVVWGSLVVARNDLFNKGDSNGRGVVAYSPHLHVHDNLDGLIAASQAMMQLREKRSLDADEKVLKKQLDSNTDWFGPRSLPASVTEDSNILATSVLVVRKHLLKSRLLAGCFPVLTHPEIDSIAIVPDRFWPQELKDSWN